LMRRGLRRIRGRCCLGRGGRLLCGCVGFFGGGCVVEGMSFYCSALEVREYMIWLLVWERSCDWRLEMEKRSWAEWV